MEPERPIEKLLRAFAKKRREDAGAPFEMHPATRRMLQGEVSRKFGKSAATEKQSFLQGLVRAWPRFAWGVGVVGLMAVMAAVLLPTLKKDKHAATFAKTEERLLTAPEPPFMDQPGGRRGAEVDSVQPAKDINAPTAQGQLADKNLNWFDSEKESVRKKEQVAGEKDYLFAPAAPKAAETPLTLAAQSRDESRMKEVTKTPARDGLALSDADRSGGAPMLRRSDAPSQNFAVAVESQTAPALSPTAIGGALPSRSLADSAVRGQPQPLPPSGAPVQPGLAGGPVKQLKPATDSLAKTAAAPAPSPPLPLEIAAVENKTRFFADDAKKDVTNFQRFAQVIPNVNAKLKASSKVAPAQKVLVSFQLEQNGHALRILDEDGSVYSGYLQITNAVTRAPGALAETSREERFYRKRAVETELGQLPAQNLVFRVAGTNRSLKENVVFTGALLELTNANLLTSVSNSWNTTKNFGSQNLSSQNGDFGNVQLFNTTISGKAQVGNRKEIEIKAVPVAR